MGSDPLLFESLEKKKAFHPLLKLAILSVLFSKKNRLKKAGRGVGFSLLGLVLLLFYIYPPLLLFIKSKENFSVLFFNETTVKAFSNSIQIAFGVFFFTTIISLFLSWITTKLALGRALIMEPSILLMDEPLSNLDTRLREDMQIEIRRIQKKLSLTTILVTHDQREAYTISDKIILMNKGIIEEEGMRDEVFFHSTSDFAKNFIRKQHQESS